MKAKTFDNQRLSWNGRFAPLLAACLLLITSVSLATPASADILFTENFESYAPGSNLVGQGGWIDAPFSGSVITVANGTFLPTQVFDGRAATGLFQLNGAEHLVSLDPAAITTLLFDAYAVSSAPITHNAEVSIYAPGPGARNHVTWQAANSGGSLGWLFIVFAGGSSNQFSVPGGYDRSVSMGIVLDGVANEAYGLYDFGSGFVQTPHFAVTDAQLATLNAVYLFVDHGATFSYTGMEVDDLRVSDNKTSAIPEPTTLLLLAVGLVGLVLAKQRKRRMSNSQ